MAGSVTFMNPISLVKTLQEALTEIPMLDAHTHLVGGRLCATGLHDVLLYHMVISDLYAAGCPNGNRLTQYPSFPDVQEAHLRIKEALPYLSRIRNTSCSWLLRIILRDLYEWEAPITSENWLRLDAIIRERSCDGSAPRRILDRLNIRRSVTEIARRGMGNTGPDDELLQYSLEWAFFTRCQWGEFDTALYELERCWGHGPDSPSPIGSGQRPRTERTIQTLADVHAAIRHYVESIPYGQILSMATHLSTDIDYRLVDDAEMERALARRSQAGPKERDIYASYINEAFLTELESRTEKVVFQFSLGAEPLPYETASRLSQQTIAQIAEIIGRHPSLQFQCFVSSQHANQSLCTLVRELPNLSLAGYWWHNFFPEVMRQIMGERLDMLPLNKQVGFFSDAYCIDWVYGKAVLVRRVLAETLAARIERGQYSFEDALDVARGILFETPQVLLGIEPRKHFPSVS